MTAARDEIGDEVPTPQDGEEEASSEQTKEKETSDDDVKQAPAFTQTMDVASQSVQEQLTDDLDLIEEAEDLSDDQQFSRPELRDVLSDLAQTEINKNRKMYRSIIYQNLNEQCPQWDDGLDQLEVGNKIDELIDTSVQVWVDRHIDEFVEQMDGQETDSGRSLSLKDVAKVSVAASIVRGIIERTASDAIYDYGREISSDVLDWFVTQTNLSLDQLFNAVEAMMRALFGV